MDNLKSFFDKQLAGWPDAKKRFDDLKQVEVKPLGVIKAQFNSARMVSTGAKVDKETLSKRPCFLCQTNRPTEQIVLKFNAEFDILVNPFPILPIHFTLPLRKHELQKIEGRLVNMLHFVNENNQYMIFYNGPKCGASAPDHMHFQAGTKEVLPVFTQWERLKDGAETIISLEDGSSILWIKDYVSPLIAITSKEIGSSDDLFKKLYKTLLKAKEDIEPMMNIVVWKQEDEYVTLVFPRYKHRPDCYYAEGDRQCLVSPGAIDMSGLIVMPRKEDFERITAEQASSILREVSIPLDMLNDLITRLKS